MLLYKDLMTGDEVLTDTYKINTLAKGAVLSVDGKFVALKDENDFDIGANASAEGEDNEELASDVRQVIDVVNNGRLKETSFDKKTYMGAIKKYMTAIKTHLEANKPDRVKDFQEGAQEFVKGVLGSFDDYCFYTGESEDLDNGMIILAKYDDTGLKPTFFFWADGLKEEKV